MHRRTLLAASLASPALASPALAQSDPVRLVVAFPPGAANDAIARLLADAAGRSGIGAAVVENRAGAAGNIAAAFVARARPDGRTLLTTLDATFTVNPHVYPSLGFEPAALEPVAQLGHFPLALLAHPSAGITDMAGFVAAARARSLLYATAGAGSPGHLAMEALRLRLGLAPDRLEQVPMRGNAQAVAELVAGRVPVGILAIGGGPQFIREGLVRAIATSGTLRDPALPDVPTLAESGLPGFDIRFAFGLWAPRGTPEAAKAPWLTLAREVFASQAARITALGVAPEAGDAAALSGWIATQSPRWAEVAREARMRVE